MNPDLIKMEESTEQLWFPEAQRATNNMSSFGSAVAMPDEAGKEQSKKSLFDRVGECWKGQEHEEIPFDRIDPVEISDSVFQRLQERNTITAPIPSCEILRQRIDQLKALENPVSNEHREIKLIAHQIAEETFSDVRRIIDHVVNQSPFAVTKFADDAFSYFATFRRTTERKGLNPLTRIVHFFERLANKPGEIPQFKVETLSQKLLAEAEELTNSFANYVVQRVVFREFDVYRERMCRHLGLLKSNCERLNREFDLVSKELDLRVRYLNSNRSMLGQSLVLGGHSEGEAVQMMCDRFHFAQADLPQAILEEHWLPAILEGPDSPATIWEVTADQMLDKFDEITNQAFPRYSLYKAIEEFGTKNVASTLFRNAQPLIFLARKHPKLNVFLKSSGIVTLPEPSSKTEDEVFQELTNTLANLSDNTISVDCRSDAPNQVVLMRTVSGFSAALIDLNRQLASSYVNGCPDHCPHLIGVYEHSPDGRPADIVKSLVKSHTQSETQN